RPASVRVPDPPARRTCARSARRRHAARRDRGRGWLLRPEPAEPPLHAPDRHLSRAICATDAWWIDSEPTATVARQPRRAERARGVCSFAAVARSLVWLGLPRFADRRVLLREGLVRESSSAAVARVVRARVFRRAVKGPPARRSAALVPDAEVST